jgi:hypothetical protein
MREETTTATQLSTATVSASMRLKRHDMLWLAIAVSLHAILLLIPLRHPPSATELTPVLSVSLLTPVNKDLDFENREPPVATAVELQAPDELPLRQGLPLAEKSIPADPAAMEAGPEDPLTPITTARLLDSASRFKWPVIDKKETRQLGVFAAQQIPDNWRPRITVEDNLFNGMVLPTKTEIVDRWLAADGTHNVVLNTPSGNTLCGRAQPWTPMNPLLEPIMTFWKCGGGGKRAFKMPDRYMRSQQQRR